ncbi:MAG: FG-GAP-like repeat-containing protein [Candidatus Latescibacterota bacterium]|jgi:hypothetical protein
MIRHLIIAAVLYAAGAQAMTWSFDTGDDAGGWRARTHWASPGGGTPVRSEVHDGVWSVASPITGDGELRLLELVSPRIGHGSVLFDRITVRLRLIAPSPYFGMFGVSWTNEYNSSSPGAVPSTLPGQLSRPWLVHISQYQMFTQDWQTVSVANLEQRTVLIDGRPFELMWAGELIDARLMLGFGMEAEGIEIDWIQLTGLQEQLQGELPPPVVAADMPPGGLFMPAQLQPLGAGVAQGSFVLLENPGAALGDLDGDGDLDLAVVCEEGAPGAEIAGWLVAWNDGCGRFTVGTREVFRSAGPTAGIVTLEAADLTGDGLADLGVGQGIEWSRLLTGRHDGPPLMWREWSNARLVLGDVDGDGDSDLYLVEFSPTPSLSVVMNQGEGTLGARQSVSLRVPREGMSPTAVSVRNLEAGRTGILWTDVDQQGKGYEVTWLDHQGEVVQHHLDCDDHLSLVRYVGDFDQDGDVDVVASTDRISDLVAGTLYRGLSLLVNNGQGHLADTAWMPQAQLPVRADLVCWADLNRDERLDAVFVDSGRRSTAVVVALATAEGLPEPEGRYLLEGVGGMVLTGDVDGDGDVDLVVLESKSVEGEGGVHVLLNRCSDLTTVVAESDPDMLRRLALGPAYPNPSNPTTVLPLTIPDGGMVRVDILNLAGQSIRCLQSGYLSAGDHKLTWDGRGETGQPVASGVYLCRAQTGSQVQVRRVVKVE